LEAGFMLFTEALRFLENEKQSERAYERNERNSCVTGVISGHKS